MTALAASAAALLAALALAACGGRATPAPVTSVTSSPSGTPAPAATPFDTAKVKATLAAAAPDGACPTEHPTVDAMMAQQRTALGPPLDETFTCRAGDEPGDPWTCTWSISVKPPATPSADDPCGDACCTGFMIMVSVTADGAIVPASATCVAPG